MEEASDRLLLISHMGIPEDLPDRERARIAEEVADRLARRFQGVTVLRSEGFWLTDEQWSLDGESGADMGSATNLTFMLAVLPGEEDEAADLLCDAVTGSTRHLGEARPRHLHIEILRSNAHHRLLP